MSELKTIGIGKTMGKKLCSVGINTAEKLMEIGSRQAVVSLKAKYPNTCVVILYHLEAAIQGVEIKNLNAQCKLELREFFDKCK